MIPCVRFGASAWWWLTSYLRFIFFCIKYAQKIIFGGWLAGHFSPTSPCLRLPNTYRFLFSCTHPECCVQTEQVNTLPGSRHHIETALFSLRICVALDAFFSFFLKSCYYNKALLGSCSICIYTSNRMLFLRIYTNIVRNKLERLKMRIMLDSFPEN